MAEPNSIQARCRARVSGMQRIGFGFLEEFEDHRRFENHRFLAVLMDAQQRHLAERRDRPEPGRLVGEIDGDALERHALLGK
ncbi:hypothetical protein MesoLj131a_27430 [Mesorhizobium sp. 131-2-1]|nr:hypothetical protein MesoLj131a_27430 [Mesorhizobium sp. 131-2-1]